MSYVHCPTCNRAYRLDAGCTNCRKDATADVLAAMAALEAAIARATPEQLGSAWSTIDRRRPVVAIDAMPELDGREPDVRRLAEPRTVDAKGSGPIRIAITPDDAPVTAVTRANPASPRGRLARLVDRIAASPTAQSMVSIAATQVQRFRRVTNALRAN